MFHASKSPILRIREKLRYAVVANGGHARQSPRLIIVVADLRAARISNARQAAPDIVTIANRVLIAQSGKRARFRRHARELIVLIADAAGAVCHGDSVTRAVIAERHWCRRINRCRGRVGNAGQQMPVVVSIRGDHAARVSHALNQII